MFSNFVTFAEVSKLSPFTHHRMKEINYHDKLLKLIYEKKDVDTFKEVIELVENKHLIKKSPKNIALDYPNRKKWLEAIFSTINS